MTIQSLQNLAPIRPYLLIAAILGFLGINLPFLYILAFKPEIYQAAMNNGIALLFMAEAFLLMFFLAYLIAKSDMKKPGWIFFIAMSILGSLAFSIPFQLYLALGKPK